MTSSPASPVRSGRRAILLIFGVVACTLPAIACSDDGGADAAFGLENEATVGGVDREAVLGELAEVREFFASSSEIPADILTDVAYDDGTLNVTLAAEAEGVEDAEQICNDLSEGIQLPDLAIVVSGPDGARLASCEFGQ